MIEIIECLKPGYPARTKENVLNSDVTIAIAKNFDTPGEKLTESLCGTKKLYIPIEWGDSYVSIIGIVHDINVHTYPLKEIIINIAGNGIYTLQCEQEYVNTCVQQILMKIISHPDLIPKIILVRSGGQTGIDEAGVIAAHRLGIPALVLAPNGYLFRDINHKDIANKELFCKRFKT